jgi:hypothetical protein
MRSQHWSADFSSDIRSSIEPEDVRLARRYWGLRRASTSFADGDVNRDAPQARPTVLNAREIDIDFNDRPEIPLPNAGETGVLPRIDWQRELETAAASSEPSGEATKSTTTIGRFSRAARTTDARDGRPLGCLFPQRLSADDSRSSSTSTVGGSVRVRLLVVPDDPLFDKAMTSRKCPLNEYQNPELPDCPLPPVPCGASASSHWVCCASRVCLPPEQLGTRGLSGTFILLAG